jgi:hypothetical protein
VKTRLTGSYRDYAIWALGAYAVVFGIVVTVASFTARRGLLPGWSPEREDAA